MLFIWIGIYMVFLTVLIAVGTLVQYVLPISDTVMQVAVIIISLVLTEWIFDFIF